jgi:hypothetical protein
MLRRLALLAALAAAGGGGCGSESRPFPPACAARPAAVAHALRTAPATVRLGDGTRLSTCVERATSDAELQSVGLALTPAAEALAERARSSDVAALRLGYLVGAARRGARRTPGVQAELVRRLEQAMGLDGPPPARRPAYRRGVAAGEARG